MLSEWERDQWQRIETSLASSFVPAAHRERRRAAISAAVFPTGYLALALVYALVSMGGALLPLLAGTALVGLALWVLLEVRLVAGSRMPVSSPRRSRWGRTT